MQCRHIPAAVVGRGTRARLVGCIARRWNTFWDSSWLAIDCASIHAFRAAGANLKSHIVAATRRITSKFRIRTSCVAGLRVSRLMEPFSQMIQFS